MHVGGAKTDILVQQSSFGKRREGGRVRERGKQGKRDMEGRWGSREVKHKGLDNGIYPAS